jgi:hypothetical protein
MNKIREKQIIAQANSYLAPLTNSDTLNDRIQIAKDENTLEAY